MKSIEKKGFTLIEMLIVIAIIAVLVAVVVPTIVSATQKAQAATDAANLRSVHACFNARLYSGESPEDIFPDYIAPKSMYDKGAEMIAYYIYPAVFEVYYVNENSYYSLEYMAELAAEGETEIPTNNPHPDADPSCWYTFPTSAE